MSQPPPAIFEPDFSQRERARMAGQLRELGKQAMDAADALETRKDSDLVPLLFMLMLSGGLNLKAIMTEVLAAKKNKKLESEEFPSVIGG